MISFGSKNTRQMGRGRCPSEEALRSSHRTRMERLVARWIPVSPDTALRLAKFLSPPRSSGSTCRWPSILLPRRYQKKDDIATIENYAEACLAACLVDGQGQNVPGWEEFGPSSAFIGFGPKNHHIGPVYGQGCQPLPDRREGIVEQITPSISHFDAIDLAQTDLYFSLDCPVGAVEAPDHRSVSMPSISPRSGARAGSMACQTRNPCSREPSVEA